MGYIATLMDDSLVLHGTFQPGGCDKVLTHSDSHIVAKRKGYSENPGSRYSGLKSYYPATTTVYEIEGKDKFGRLILSQLISWEAKRK